MSDIEPATRDFKCDGEEWTAELSALLVGQHVANKRILRFKRDDVTVPTHVHEGTHLDKLTDDELCRKLRQLRRTI